MTPRSESMHEESSTLERLVRDQRFQEAAALADRPPEDDDHRLLLAAALYKTGSLPRAAELLDALLEGAECPSPAVVFLRGVVEYDLRHHHNALEWFARVHADDTRTRSRLHHYRGLACYYLDSFDRAQREFASWVRLDDSLPANHNLAVASTAAGDDATASQALARCIEIDETRAAYYSTLLIALGETRARKETAHQVHRFKNLMSVLGADFREAAASLDGHGGSMEGIVRRQEKLLCDLSRFLSSLRPGPVELDVVDLRDELEDLLPGLMARRDDIAIRRRFAEDDYHVVGDRFGLREALVNLVCNACEAMDDGGTLTLTGRADSERVEIAVADNGPGLSPEARDRIFLPGFSTKPFGSGFGLVQARMAVEASGGRLAAADNPGGGAAFTLRHDRFPSPALGSRPPAPMIVGHEDVLWLIDAVLTTR